MAKIKAKAASLDITIEQGSDLDITMTWRDSNSALIDLTGYSAEMDIRDTVESVAVLFELSTVNSRIVLGGVLGTIQLLITAAESTAFTFTTGVYDLELTDPLGVVTRLIKGNVVIDPDVTRA